MAAKERKRVRKRGQVRHSRGWVILICAAVATVIIAAVVGIGALSQGGYSDAGGQVIMPTPGVPGLTRNGRVLGEAGAPVSIVEYADFQ